ncbi:MAG: cyclase family protein [Patescibacteria group bacterium]
MFIDLSVSLNETTPVYPGDPETQIRPAGMLAESGYQDHYVCVGTHVGTHMDAPSHMIVGGKNLDEFPIEKFSGRGVCIRMDGSFDPTEIQKADIQEGDIVLFHTGMSEKYQEPAYFENYPGVPEDVAQYLIEKKVKIVGVDMCSVDTESDFPIHKLLLGKEVLIIENLTNLEALEGKTFKVHAFPIKLQIDGAPVRVVAEL